MPPSLTVRLLGEAVTPARSALLMMMVNVCWADRLPSLAVTVTDNVPTSPDWGVPEKVRSLAVKLSQVGKAVPSAFVAVWVSVSPSGSVNVFPGNA